MGARTRAIAAMDQAWKNMEDSLDTFKRIAETGPIPGDEQLIRAGMALIAAEIHYRRGEMKIAEQDTGL